jgi:hypothetical protein
MSHWQEMVLAFGGQVGLLALLAFLGRSLIGHWINKDIERFKHDLTSTAASAIEKTRHELRLAATEHNIHYSKLHERRAEVIATLYRKLVETYWAYYGFVSPLEVHGEPTKLEKFGEVHQAAATLFRYFEENRIFLPSEICETITNFLEGMRRSASNFGMTLLVARDDASVDAQKTMRKAWKDAWGYFDRGIVEPRTALERDFRALLEPPKHS